MEVELSNWEVLMLAGPVLGNMLIWLLTLWIWNPDDIPQTPRQPQPRRNGPERIPIRHNKSGTALSDFVRAMREEDAEPPRTASTLTPGIPTRIRIPSPKPFIHTPLFPLSAPLSGELVVTPRSPHLSTFARQMNTTIDTTISASPHATALPFPPFKIEYGDHNDGTSPRSAPSLPSYPGLVDEANTIPLPQSPLIEAKFQPHTKNAIPPPQNFHENMTHPGSSRRVRFTPRTRVVSTGAQLFPVDEEDPLSPDVDSLALSVGPAI
ncbi:hypothetical protein BLS_000718 [Venturia inaequalis]|uniref:Uncharacterized protein n=1 Tax=Venturia inaequalis TaxID=5025 RepID=A0A8H3U2S8_VENIN|nr:hypothetical protein BLS_000718 [Venturia inaequalis]